MKLSKHQAMIMNDMANRAVIGEFSGKFDSSYELFSFKNKTVTTIKRATFFALLEKGCIHEGDRKLFTLAVQGVFREPFSRDHWYIAKASALREMDKKGLIHG
jgi:hypothetical protein